MFHVTVFEREEHIRDKKGVGICQSNLKKKFSEKRSAEARNRTHCLSVRFRCLNLYSTELLKFYASRPSTSFMCSQIRKHKGKSLRQNEEMEHVFFAFGFVVESFVHMKLYLNVISQRTFQRKNEHVGKSVFTFFIARCHLLRFNII